MIIEELINELHKKARKLPLGVKTPIFEIKVDNVLNSGHSIYPGWKVDPYIYFYTDSEGDVTLIFQGR